MDVRMHGFFKNNSNPGKFTYRDFFIQSTK